MLNEDIQFEILSFLYGKWFEDVFNLPRVGELLESEDIDIEEDALYANADYLVEKGLIESPKTTMFSTRITKWGILEIENKRFSPDSIKRQQILEYLGRVFNASPEKYTRKEEFLREFDFDEVELERIMWFLDEMGYIKARWYGGRDFEVKISHDGLDVLKKPSTLEIQSNVMAYAYSLLFKLENNLRMFIEITLRAEFGDAWWEKGVPNKIRAKAERNKRNENGDFGNIHYTDFEDLKLIPNKKWYLFKETFKTQSGIISRLNELEPIRNKIAHSRLLKNPEIKSLELFYKQIIDMLDK